MQPFSKNMRDNNSSSRSKQEEQKSLRELEQALSEVNGCDQKNLTEFVSKFTKYYKLFKEIFPECVKGYDLKSPWSGSGLNYPHRQTFLNFQA